MAGATARLALVKPLTSEQMSIYDRQASDDYLKIDNAIGVKSVTSFPGSPFTGQIVYRTDQSKAYFWNGVSWVEWGGVAGAQGVKNGDAILSSPFQSTTTTEKSLLSSTFDIVTNRRYLIYASGTFEFQDNIEDFFRCTLRWRVGVGIPTAADTLIRELRTFVDSTGTYSAPITVFEEFAYSGPSQTISLGLLFRSESIGNTIFGGNATGTGGFTPQTAIDIYDYGAF